MAVVLWTVAILRSRPATPIRHDLFIVGFVLLASTVVGALSTRRHPVPSQVDLVPAELVVPPDPAREETAPSSTEPALPALIAEAAWQALQAGGADALRSPAADVAVIRVGPFGVEVLLEGPHPAAPAPFSVEAGGYVWRLDPAVDLELSSLGSGEGGEEPSARLVEIGSDEDGSYYVDGSKLSWIRLDDDDDALQDRSPAPGFFSPLVIVERGDDRLLEPYGLVIGTRRVTGDQTGELKDEGDLPESDAAEPAAWEEASAEVDAEPVVSSQDDERASGEVVPARILGPGGRVEVRILRETPDLIGELANKPSTAAVEFVAYLCLHGRRATSARLKEALGTARSRGGRSMSSIWRAAGEARHSLGTELVPQSSASQLYEISADVSCDWTRLRELVEIARAPSSDQDRCRQALTEALSLVDGVPALASRRFTWLDSEGVLSEIGTVVGRAVEELVRIAEDTQDAELRRFALEKARILVPDTAEWELPGSATTSPPR